MRSSRKRETTSRSPVVIAAIVASVFFDAVGSGSAAEAFQRTLIVPAVTLTIFLAVSFAFPRTSRKDAHAIAVTDPVS